MHEPVVKVWPQKWCASASPGCTALATTPPIDPATSPAPTRARKPRRDVSPASESSASPIRSRPAISWARSVEPRLQIGPPPVRRGQDALELREVVEGPLRQHDAAVLNRQRERAPGDPKLVPC